MPSFNFIKFAVRLFAIGIFASIAIPILVAVKHTTNQLTPTISIPSFNTGPFNTGPTAVRGQRHPAQGQGHGQVGDPNLLSNLITLSAADEIYRAQHGGYTTRVGALSQQQFRIDPRGQFRIGVGKGGYCIVGRESASGWRVYDNNNPTNIANTYRDEATAMKSCSLPVHWGS